MEMTWRGIFSGVSAGNGLTESCHGDAGNGDRYQRSYPHQVDEYLNEDGITRDHGMRSRERDLPCIQW